eukprot:156532_1
MIKASHRGHEGGMLNLDSLRVPRGPRGVHDDTHSIRGRGGERRRQGFALGHHLIKGHDCESGGIADRGLCALFGGNQMEGVDDVPQGGALLRHLDQVGNVRVVGDHGVANVGVDGSDDSRGPQGGIGCDDGDGLPRRSNQGRHPVRAGVLPQKDSMRSRKLFKIHPFWLGLKAQGPKAPPEGRGPVLHFVVGLPLRLLEHLEGEPCPIRLVLAHVLAGPKAFPWTENFEVPLVQVEGSQDSGLAPDQFGRGLVGLGNRVASGGDAL